MRYFIDSGNLEDIKKLAEVFPITGMTTNPEILSREKRNPFELYKQIHREIPQLSDFHMQVVSTEAKEIVKEAIFMREKLTAGADALEPERFYVKVPVDRAGVQAMMELRRMDIPFTATGVFTSGQCLLAADLGASFVAPYISPISCGGFDGLQVLREARSLFETYGHHTQILGAGFSLESQIAQAGLAGADIITAPPAVLEKFMAVPQTKIYTDRFIKAFQDFAGEGATLMSFE